MRIAKDIESNWSGVGEDSFKSLKDPEFSTLMFLALEQALASDLAAWQLNTEGTRLERQWKFPDFGHAMAFVVRVALLAERQDHHPDIRIVYNNVWLSLTSHDAGGLTERDLHLARCLDTSTQPAPPAV
jgi:4a-hydroxytetrahydrobiopterin dehydratase